MALTVLDSSNLDAIIADSRGETVEVVEKPVATSKPEESKPVIEDEAEDDNGLTAKQREEMTATMQKTIGKKHRMMKEAEEFAAAQYAERKLAEQRAEQIERELNELKGKAKVEDTPKESVTKPVRGNYQSDDDYIEALAAYRTEQLFAEREATAQKKAAEERYNEIITAAKARIETARELVPDFAEVTGSADIPIPSAIANYMQESELFAEIGYHFAKNPDVVKDLQKLTIDKQLVAIGKIESKLTPFGKAAPTEKPSNDEKSSQEIPSNGKQNTAPSEKYTGAFLSKSRTEAPVIKPLSDLGNASNQVDPENIRDVIADYTKTHKANFAHRKRH